MPTILPSPGAPDVLYLIDLAALLHRHFHGRAPTQHAGARVEAVRGVVGMLLRLIEEQQPAYLALADEALPVDGQRRRTWHHDLLEAYKAARPPLPAELAAQWRLAREAAWYLAIPVLAAEGHEADDVLAAAAARAVAAGLRVVILGADKDLQQLAGERVVLWNPAPPAGRAAVLGAEEVHELWGVGPEQLGDLLALAGDAVDGVPGVPGVGKKKAADLLRLHGRLARVLRNAGGIPGKLGQNIRQHLAAAVLSRQLVTLRAEAPIEWNFQAMRIGGVGDAARAGLERRLGIIVEDTIPPGPKPAVPAAVLERFEGWDPAVELSARLTAEAELSAVVRALSG